MMSGCSCRRYHEAGHAVAAIALGTPVKRATISVVTTLVRGRLPACPPQRSAHRLGWPAGRRPVPKLQPG